MKRKIRFLATSDIHSDQNLLNAIEQYTDWEDIDFVVLTGDLSDKKNDFENILSTFQDKKILMVPGNHETRKSIESLKTSYNIHLIGNNPLIINQNLVFFGSNYMSIGQYGINEEKVFENIIQNYEAIKDIKCKVHLSHIPPAETIIGNASPFFPIIEGSVAVREFLENFKPNMTLVGHIHESSGLEEIVNETKVVNIGKTFKIFEFDNETIEINEIKPKTHKPIQKKKSQKVNTKKTNKK